MYVNVAMSQSREDLLRSRSVYQSLVESAHQWAARFTIPSGHNESKLAAGGPTRLPPVKDTRMLYEDIACVVFKSMRDLPD